MFLAVWAGLLAAEAAVGEAVLLGVFGIAADWTEAWVFDGEIGDALASIKPLAECSSWTSLYTYITFSAPAIHRHIVIHLQIGENLSQIELTAFLGDNQVVVPPYPPKSGFLGPIALQDRCRVYKYPIARESYVLAE